MLEARPFLKQMGITAESTGFIVFKVAKCQAHLWTRQKMTEPRKYLKFA